MQQKRIVSKKIIVLRGEYEFEPHPRPHKVLRVSLSVADDHPVNNGRLFQGFHDSEVQDFVTTNTLVELSFR